MTGRQCRAHFLLSSIVFRFVSAASLSCVPCPEKAHTKMPFTGRIVSLVGSKRRGYEARSRSARLTARHTRGAGRGWKYNRVRVHLWNRVAWRETAFNTVKFLSAGQKQIGLPLIVVGLKKKIHVTQKETRPNTMAYFLNSTSRCSATISAAFTTIANGTDDNWSGCGYELRRASRTRRSNIIYGLLTPFKSPRIAGDR